jgi:hypothetical protein
LLVFQRLYLAFLAEHNPAAFMINVVLIKTRVSRLTLGRDALMLEGALVEIHEGGWTGKDKSRDGRLRYDGRETGARERDFWMRK